MLPFSSGGCVAPGPERRLPAAPLYPSRHPGIYSPGDIVTDGEQNAEPDEETFDELLLDEEGLSDGHKPLHCDGESEESRPNSAITSKI